VSLKFNEAVNTNGQQKYASIPDFYSVHTMNPEPSDGTIILEVNRTSLYRFRHERKGISVQNNDDDDSSGPRLLTYAGMGAIVVGALMIPECVRNDDLDCTEEDRDRTTTAYTVVGAGLGALLLSLIQSSSLEHTHSLKGSYELATRSSERQTEYSASQALPNEEVIFKLNGARKKYVTNEEGQFSIDLARDFGLRSLQKPTPQVATLILPKQKHAESVTLDPTQWMKEHIRARTATTLHSRPDSNAKLLSTIKRGEELKIVKTHPKWIHVRGSEGAGWIRESNAERFWAISQHSTNRTQILAKSTTEALK